MIPPLIRQLLLRQVVVLLLPVATAGALRGANESSPPVVYDSGPGINGNDRSGNSSLPASAQPDPMPIFFPPTPPPLDYPIPAGPPAEATANLIPALELSAYVSEVFYPPLGARLARGTLTEKLRRDIDGYCADELALLRELRAELERLEPETAAVRLRALEALARQQAPRLAEREKRADQLRRNLIQLDHGWDDFRQWHLRGSEALSIPTASQKAARGGSQASPRTIQRGFSPDEISQVMRAAAYYLPNLLPAQRRLLREIALELTLAGEDSAVAAAQPHVFFSPELARVSMPDNLSPGAMEKLAAHQAQKAKLKKELYDAIYEQDRPGMNLFRGNRLKELAVQQAQDLAALEQLAENFRRDLPPLKPRASVPSVLPAALYDRIAAVPRTLAALQQETVRKIQPILARAYAFKSTYSFDSSGLRFSIVFAPGKPGGRREPHPQLRQRLEEITAEMAQVAAEYGRRYLELTNDQDTIRTEIARAIGDRRPAVIEAAFSAALRLAAEEKVAQAYHEYRVAVFEPGLSLEQRRLLFDSAVEQLDLPLPLGDLQPMNRELSQ
jgi:hypothetical protein